VADYEIDSIFGTMDKNNSGSIAKDEFMDRFGRDEQELLFQTGIEDIIKPLVTVMKRQNKTVVDIFREYDTNRNEMLSAKELQVALKNMMQFEMSQDEVNTMHEFFRAKFKRSEIKKADLAEILSKPTFVRKWESQQAKSTLSKIKKRLRETGR